jgi:hypothetical protein
MTSLYDAEYDWSLDSFLSFDLWISYRREIGVRAGKCTPRNDREVRQAAEGPCPQHEMDCMKREARRP